MKFIKLTESLAHEGRTAKLILNTDHIMYISDSNKSKDTYIQVIGGGLNISL